MKRASFRKLLSVLLALIILSCSVVTLSSCASEKGEEKDTAGTDPVAVRYFLSDDYNYSPVVVVQAEPGEDFTIPRIPQKSGHLFIGLYDGKNHTTATAYVDANGANLRTVTEDIVLYPAFIKTGN